VPPSPSPVEDAGGIRPYADHRDDGIVQVSFTLPVHGAQTARFAALEVARHMGLSRSEVVYHQKVTDGYTYLVLYGHFEDRVSDESIHREGFEDEYMGKDEVDAFVKRTVGREIVVVGASTGSDTHSVGIDAMLNLKGFDGHHGLEGYEAFATYNLGSQVPNTVLVARALELEADAIVVSQTVTQQDLHIHNLTELVEMVEAEGMRASTTLVCGGPRISDELAKELGYDAGFSKGTFPNHLATFLARAVASQADTNRETVLQGDDRG
jgi:beta-lysine 5,6-aminomutase beta subunit